MIVCPHHRLLYMCPVNTGTGRVTDQLRQSFNGHQYGKLHVFHSTVWEEQFRPFYKFITVKHPYHRMLEFWRTTMDSIREFKELQPEQQYLPEHDVPRWWLDHVGDEDTQFVEFIAEPLIQHLMCQGVWSCFWHIEQMQMPINKIVHLERFDEDIHQVPGLWTTNFPPLSPPPQLAKPWYDYYNVNTAQLVQNCWPRDFLPLGYNPNLKEVVQGKLFV